MKRNHKRSKRKAIKKNAYLHMQEQVWLGEMTKRQAIKMLRDVRQALSILPFGYAPYLSMEFITHRKRNGRYTGISVSERILE